MPLQVCGHCALELGIKFEDFDWGLGPSVVIVCKNWCWWCTPLIPMASSTPPPTKSTASIHTLDDGLLPWDKCLLALFSCVLHIRMMPLPELYKKARLVFRRIEDMDPNDISLNLSHRFCAEVAMLVDAVNAKDADASSRVLLGLKSTIQPERMYPLGPAAITLEVRVCMNIHHQMYLNTVMNSQHADLHLIHPSLIVTFRAVDDEKNDTTSAKEADGSLVNVLLRCVPGLSEKQSIQLVMNRNYSVTAAYLPGYEILPLEFNTNESRFKEGNASLVVEVVDCPPLQNPDPRAHKQIDWSFSTRSTRTPLELKMDELDELYETGPRRGSAGHGGVGKAEGE